jgi:hypothetical protein
MLIIGRNDRKEIGMRSIPSRALVRSHILFVAVLSLATAGAQAQTMPPETARSQSDSGLTLSADVFCSETKLRTANVTLRWSLSSDARSKTGLTTFAAAKQVLETTVFAGGFEKGLYVSLPVPARTAAPVRPVAPAGAQARQVPLRASQIQLIESGPAGATAAAAAAESGEFRAVIEDLEPGVNYTWRVTIETSSGKLMSAPVTVQAPTCPADMIQPKQTPRRPR